MAFDLRAWQLRAEEVLNTPIPKELIQEREQAGQRLNYINSATATAILNRAFGVGGWEFVKIGSGVRESMEDRRGNKGHTMVYEGELRVFIPDAVTGQINTENYARFPGFGTKTMFGGANEDQMADKSAQSDCFKKCASIIGVGSQLYFKKKSMYSALMGFLSQVGVDPEPSVWDDPALVAQYQEEWDFLAKIKSDSGATDEDLDEMVVAWSNKTISTVRDIPPARLKGFTDYMRNVMNDEAEVNMMEGAAG